MSVFISHRKIDRIVALRIYKYLVSHGVPAYIDELDEELREPADITEIIMKRVNACPYLMAVVSPSTKGSWWVPFEIGVASDSERRISTFKIKQSVVIPEFLKIWPVMYSLDQLKKYIWLYKNDKKTLIEKRAAPKVKRAAIQSADQFHGEMKAYLGQT